MAVAVYGQLERLLRERNLSVADLKRQIEERYGLAVDAAALDRLAGPEALHEIDLTLVGAAATILGIGLDDLFAVEASPVDAAAPAEPMETSFLDEEQTQRLWALLDLQSERDLSVDEQHEIQSLVDEEQRRFGEYHLGRYAARRGISIEEALHEEEARIGKAVALMKWIDADPRRRRRFIEDAKRPDRFGVALDV